MDFTFTDEQTMMRRSLADYLAQHYGLEHRQAVLRSAAGMSDKVWSQLKAMGLLAMPLPESIGGLGGTASDIVAVTELFGRHLVIEPYLSSIIFAGRALARAKDCELASAWLRQIVTGDMRAALAHEESHGTAALHMISTTAHPDGEYYVIRGEKRLVLDGAGADIVVVTARLTGDAFATLLVEPLTDGVTLTPYQTIDGRRAANIRFDQVRVSSAALLCANASQSIQDIVNDAVLSLAAEAVGAMGALLDATATYASTRTQFGVPITHFQVIAHKIADMKLAYVKARSTLLYTTALVESGRADTRDYSLVKAQVGRLV
ncbi:acyl-CoA dehydrogenase family protein [Mycobacterium sp.]|uniref:acyl-CoA dehydrogenase family protein n=1 Tax=Mycobacterium sp. TaxID=1785 RepID=UPI003D6A6A7B